MEKGTFSDDNVIEFVNDNFISAKVKTTINETFKTPLGEMNTGQLTRSLRIRGVPAIFFFDTEGKPVYNIPGYVSPDTYQDVLRYVAGEHYKTMTFDEFKESKEVSL